MMDPHMQRSSVDQDTRTSRAPKRKRMSLAQASRNVVPLLRPERTALLVCDVQERMRSVIGHFDSVLACSKILLDAARLLDVPVIVTEQYPKAFLRTCEELEPSKLPMVVEKTRFSMVVPEVENKLVNELGVESVVLVGVEAHVCVLQTALDLTRLGINVHVAADGVSSRFPTDRALAMKRMQAAGAVLTSTESVCFQLMQDAKHPVFKQVSALIKPQRPNPGLLNAML